MNNILLKLYKVKSYLLLTLVIVSFVFKAESQNPAINQLATDFNNLTENIHSDDAYIQTSKDIYETGEDLWFKAYVLDAQYLFPSKRSKILYVQLINDDTKQPVWEEKYEIENGFVDGHLYIQDSLKTGRYSLSGYSEHSYFQNQEAFYALKKVTIVKNIKQKVETTSVKNDSIAQFDLLPEGGHLVANIENKLAFKATDKEGLPVDVTGTLFENNLPILDFKSLHAGMGSFNFTPKKSGTYHIQLSESDKKHQLPEIKDSGKVLRLILNTDDFLSFKVSQSESLKQETIYLRLQIRGVIYSIASAKLKDDILIKIPLKDMPQGIAEVTLFDSDLKPVAERLVYVKQDQKLNIKTILNKSEYETREKATLKITVTDKENKPVKAHLGLSIFDRIYKNKQEPKNILSHYHLSSQLKGNVYNPGYYFDDTNQNKQQALDLLLLTQGWRRYVWNETNLKEQGKQLHPIVFDTIHAQVLAKWKEDRKIEIPLFVLAFNGNKESAKQVIEVDSTSKFVITPEHLKIGEKGNMYLKLYTPEYSKYNIYFKDVAFNNINESRENRSIFYPKSRIEVLEDREPEPFRIPNEVTKLDEIEIRAKRTTVFRDKYIGKLDSLVKLELSTIDYVCVEGNILNCPIHMRNSSSKRPVEGGIYQKLIIMENGNWVDVTGPIPEGTRFNNPYLPTYRYPILTDAYLMERYSLIRVKGYYGKREFYQPIYDEISIKDPFPDYRNNLLWKPDILTDKNGEATIEFYCSDINTIFIGNIEGVSQNGLLGSENFEFKVVKRD